MITKEQIDKASHGKYPVIPGQWQDNYRERHAFEAGALWLQKQQGSGMRWSIVQAIIRCGLAKNPTKAFRHQVVRLQQQFDSDSPEFKSITEMLNPDTDSKFRLVPSTPSEIDRLREENREMLEMFMEFFNRDSKIEFHEWVDAVKSLITKIESNGK